MPKTITILDYIPYGQEKAVKRGELIKRTGMNDRSVREAIERAQLGGEIIINLQDGNGYFRPILPEEHSLLTKWYSAEKGRHYSSGQKLANVERYFENG